MTALPNSTRIPLPRFTLGQLVATPGALEILQRYQTDANALIRRHSCGDWGDVCPDDARANNEAIDSDLRVISAYTLDPPATNPDLDTAKIWVITEADRSVTTLLLPEEY